MKTPDKDRSKNLYDEKTAFGFVRFQSWITPELRAKLNKIISKDKDLKQLNKEFLNRYK